MEEIMMKQASSRLVFSALLSAAALCCAGIGFAQSPLDGTWKFDMSQTKFSPKPFVFYISQGWYHCVSCNPAYDVQADGQDHSVAGHAFDSMSIKIVDDHTIAVVSKKGGTVGNEETGTVSADGKTFTINETDHPANGSAPSTFTATFKRVGIAPSGVHATSGQWQILKGQGSDNALTVTYKMNGDELTMTAPTGETYTAKLDGADYPVKNAFGYDAVSLKRIDANTIEETDKRGGKVTDVARITVAGKTLKIVDHDMINDRTSSFVATKK
jgi:hypothetical protein